ncbi:hypothetical protein M3Y95_00409800 [Aphelenchoides besseyi]|nr:hypothetical protein M3Y95_00409800 [Aphelenchoides besseyi]
MRSLILLLLFIQQIDAKVITWPFVFDYVAAVNISIGTPAQTIPIHLVITGDYPSLVVRDKAVGIGYDNNSSSTFVQTGNYQDIHNEKVGIAGTENFVIANTVIESGKPFGIIHRNYYEYSKVGGSLGFSQPTDGSTSFVQSILNEVDNQVVVFSYDSPSLTTGTVTFGGLDAARCDSNWINVPQVAPSSLNSNQWGVSIGEFSYGKYTYDKPGTAFFHIEDPEVFIPFSYSKKILDTLNAYNEFEVPCDNTVEFVFTIGQLEIRLTPEDYLTPSDNLDSCYLNIIFTVNEDEFIFGTSVFKKWCLSLDYEHSTVGFAQRLY